MSYHTHKSNFPKTALVLSGGGFRGIAHIGVVHVLQEANIQPSLVLGVSAGAVVGALYCAGVTATEMRGELAHLSLRKLVRFVWPKSYFLSLSPMQHRLERLLGDSQVFDALAIPFAAIAVDFTSMRPIPLMSGRVSDAVRASCSVPGIFPLVQRNGYLLGDGGLLAKLPVLLARDLGSDCVVAVDVAPLNSGRRIPSNVFTMLISSYRILLSRTCQEDRASADILICTSSNSLGQKQSKTKGDSLKVKKPASPLADGWHVSAARSGV